MRFWREDTGTRCVRSVQCSERHCAPLVRCAVSSPPSLPRARRLSTDAAAAAAAAGPTVSPPSFSRLHRFPCYREPPGRLIAVVRRRRRRRGEWRSPGGGGETKRSLRNAAALSKLCNNNQYAPHRARFRSASDRGCGRTYLATIINTYIIC